MDRFAAVREESERVRSSGYVFLVELKSRVITRALADAKPDDRFVAGDYFELIHTGTFFSPEYGRIDITRDHLARMFANWKTETVGVGGELPIDFDHLGDDPQKPGDGRAAGWIGDMQLRNGGDEIWVKARWTKPAATMIANGEYRFISPFFLTNGISKRTGKNIGPYIRAAGLTNRPFLEGMSEIPMPAIAASETVARRFWRDKRVALRFAEWPASKVNEFPDSSFAIVEPGAKDATGKTTPRSKRHLPYRDAAGAVDLPHLRNALARISDVKVPASLLASGRQTLQAAAKAKDIGQQQSDRNRSRSRAMKESTTQPVAPEVEAGPHPVPPKTKVPPTPEHEFEGAEPKPGLTCPHCGAPVAHHVAPAVPDADGDDDGDEMDDMGANPVESMSEEPDDMLHVDEQDGDAPLPRAESDEADDEEKPAMTEVPPAASMRERQRDRRVAALESALAETQRLLKRQQTNERRQYAEKLIDSALKAGKVTPALLGSKASPGWARSFAFRDPSGFREWLKSAPRMVEFGERGTSAIEASTSAATTAEKVDQLTRARCAAKPGLTYADATKEVLSENRSLAERYDREMIGERQAAPRSSNVRRL